MSDNRKDSMQDDVPDGMTGEEPADVPNAGMADISGVGMTGEMPPDIPDTEMTGEEPADLSGIGGRSAGGRGRLHRGSRRCEKQYKKIRGEEADQIPGEVQRHADAALVLECSSAPASCGADRCLLFH